MANTNFCCRTGGSNLNAGTLTGNTTEPGTAASFTYTSGSWVQSTGVFTLASGDPSSDGVAVGDFASVYPDAAVFTPFVGRITAVDTTTITVSATAMAGAEPVNGTLDTSIKVGGAWKGPNAAEGFPIDFIEDSLMNSSSDVVRINFKNDAVFNVTATAASGGTQDGYVVLQGYTTSYGDEGRAEITGAATGTRYYLWTLDADRWEVSDFIFHTNGNSGSTKWVLNGSGQYALYRRVTVRNGSNGFNVGKICTCIECEAHDNEVNGFVLNNDCKMIRCIAHDNTEDGFNANNRSNMNFFNCISFNNTLQGMDLGNSWLGVMTNCDFYNNGSDGVTMGRHTVMVPRIIVNCNFTNNGGYGINAVSGSSPFYLVGEFRNNAFGAGTEANTSGQTNNFSNDFQVSGTITYADNVNPWTDPANGDFRINLDAAKNAGYGEFELTDTDYSARANNVGFPAVGSQPADQSGGGGGETSHTFAG